MTILFFFSLSQVLLLWNPQSRVSDFLWRLLGLADSTRLLGIAKSHHESILELVW